jgi:hypothetical protein
MPAYSEGINMICVLPQGEKMEVLPWGPLLQKALQAIRTLYREQTVLRRP